MRLPSPGAFLHRRPRPIRFLYAPPFSHSGTSVMRGRQLSEIAASTPLSQRAIAYEPFTVPVRGSDLFLTKGVLKTADPRQLRRWKRAGNRLFFDPVDEDVPEGLAPFADVIVAASREAARTYSERWPQADVRTLDHHVDPRVSSAMRSRSASTTGEFKAGYFGEIVNTVRTDAIARRVDFVLVDTSRQDEAWLARLPGFTFHYAVRQRRALDRHKPFLKGFTAAACGANILIQASEAEPRHWLPPDYPYWLHGEVTEESILAALDEARADFGGERWRHGLAVMAEVAARTSPEAIGRQLQALFAR